MVNFIIAVNYYLSTNYVQFTLFGFWYNYFFCTINMYYEPRICNIVTNNIIIPDTCELWNSETGLPNCIIMI